MLAASDSRLPRIVAHESLPTFQQQPALKLYGCSMSETDQSCSDLQSVAATFHPYSKHVTQCTQVNCAFLE